MIDMRIVIGGIVIGAVIVLAINRDKFSASSSEKVRGGSYKIEEKSVLNVTLRPWYGCQIGDIDVIETSVGPYTPVIATIQNLADQKIVTNLVLRADQMRNERQLALPQSIAATDGNYILSICSDAARTNSCLGKKAADMKKLSSTAFQNKVLKRKITPGKVENHLFVQQAFSIKDGRLIKADNKSLASMLKDKQTTDVSKAMDSVDSMDLQYQVSPGRIDVQIPLRAYSSGFCSRQSEEENLRKTLNTGGKGERVKPIEIPPSPFSL